MNATRRKQIRKAIQDIETVCSQLESIKDAEDDVRDNTPENLQGSERYMASEDASDSIDDALAYLSSASSSLEEVFES